jgi:hypothetical protein
MDLFLQALDDLFMGFPGELGMKFEIGKLPPKPLASPFQIVQQQTDVVGRNGGRAALMQTDGKIRAFVSFE